MNQIPMQLIQMIRNGRNPQQLVMSMLEQRMGSTPMGENLLNMIKENRTNDIENFARNLCKSRGVDFDKEFASFRRQMGL